MAKISHPNEPQHVIALIKAYTEAQAKLIDVISQKLSRSSSVAYQRRLITQTNEVLTDLLRQSNEWSNEFISLEYKKGVERVIKQYEEMGIASATYDQFSRLHQGQIDVLIANTVDNFETATNFVGRRINDTVRQISIESIRQATLTGGTVQTIRKDLIQKFIDNNILAMQTRSGRNINLRSYAETVARSTTRESQNLAQMNHMRYQNKDLVQMSSHLTTCPVCAPLQGRVYSISGTSTEYPPLDIAYSGGHANVHANCRHTISPYEPELDEAVNQTREFSNRSFDIDPRSQAQINNYNKEQKENAQRNADRKQWERYKIVMPNETPKTLAGFRKSKQENSEKYQELQRNYRSIRQRNSV